MHFDLTISLGNIVTVAFIMGMIWRIERAYNLYSVEHEMLIADYCARHEIHVRDLPTRTKGVTSWRGSGG